MAVLLKNGQVFDHGRMLREDVLVDGGCIAQRAEKIDSNKADHVLDMTGLVIFPGFADVHVHLREPGFSYKETIRTGTMAAARGGYTSVCAMPNLSPVPDTPENLAEQQAIIDRDAVIEVKPFASITMGRTGGGEIVDFAALANHAAGFSDDGTGVRDEEVMRKAMQACVSADGLISAHCEDMTLIPQGGAIHDGPYAKEHGIPGIPSASEWKPIVRDIALAEETGCKYHVCHISCRESVEAIRCAKAQGVDITCETGPHYLLLTQDELQDEGRFKMNPPLRSADDRAALLEGLIDGTIDCIATDHAPHSAEEKAKGLAKSAMGIVGLETAFPVLYTCLVEKGVVSLERVIDALCYAPRRRFVLPGGIEVGEKASLTVFDLHADEKVDPEAFLSMGHATPFAGWPVHAVCRLTLLGDDIVWRDPQAAL